MIQNPGIPDTSDRDYAHESGGTGTAGTQGQSRQEGRGLAVARDPDADQRVAGIGRPIAAGGVALSTPDEHLIAVEARQLALDLTIASGLVKARPGLTWFGGVLAGLSPLIFTALVVCVGAAGYGIALLLGWA